MNKIANVVYSGWMTKSPPEKKFRLTGAWKIFRAFSQDVMDTSRWKKRFFVLFKPEGSLPHQYVLNYYSDENCKRLKGVIDLEHCEQIIESLDLELYPYLLAIKTFHKSKERTYFLATGTEDQMTTWVRNLCSVCGLKPEDNPSSEDIPPRSDTGNRNSLTANNVVDGHQAKPVSSPPVVTTQPPIPSSMVRHRNNSGEEYIPLSHCSTGEKRISPNRQDSVDSIPDEPAPPPPGKIGHSEMDNEVFHPMSTYDTPVKRENVISNSIYKVPPPRVITPDPDITKEVYDVPPPTHHSPSSPRSSSSDSQKADSAYSSQSVLPYDYLPHSDQVVSDDTYDIPPSNPQSVPSLGDVPPPPRPPKPNSLHQDQYQNIPNNSRVLSIDLDKVVPPTSLMDKHISTATYDVPPPKVSLYDRPKPPTANGENCVSANSVPPPPPSCSVSHSYINAAKGYVHNRSESDSMYLPMESSSRSRNNSDSVYHDMSGSKDPYLDMTGQQAEYDTPPARPPPRVSPRTTNNDFDTFTISSNARTRSFKRHPSSSSSGSTLEKRSLHTDPPLPSPSRHPDMETSSEDDEEYLVDPTKVMMPFYYSEQSQRTRGWGEIPPAPKQERELKYIDLSLDKISDSDTPSYNPQPPGQSTPTEYKEIDFIKTKGLQETKLDVQINRKHDDA